MLIKYKSRSVPATLITLIFISFFLFHIQNVSAEESPSEDLPTQYRDIGYNLQQQGDLNGALQFYNKALALGGARNPTLMNDIGIIYEQLGKVKTAEEHYLKSLQLDAEYLPALSNLAYLYLSKGEEERAFQYFRLRYELSDPNDHWAEQAKEELIKIKPEFQTWIVHREAVRMNEELKRRKEEELFQLVTEAAQYYDRGMEFVERNELEKALAEFNRALELTPENPKIQNARQKVIRELVSIQIKERSELAIQKLSAGDSYSARREIKQMLSTIPNEPIFNSQ